MKQVSIIGGGIAGMATAWYLQQERDDLNITLYEKTDRLGGKITTDRIGELILEGAPESLLTEKQSGIDLCHELGIADQLNPSNDDQRSFSILINGKLTPFPQGHRLFIPLSEQAIDDNPLLSTAGKQRAKDECHIPPRLDNEDESLSDFVTRRFGAEVMRNMAAPLIAGIFGGDPTRLSILSTMPRMRTLEQKHGSLTQAFSQMPPRSRTSTFTSLKTGMAQLIETLEKQLTCTIVKNAKLQNINDLESDHVIIAIPAYAAAKLLEATHPTQSELLKTWRYTSSGTLSMVYCRDEINVPPGFGFMTPDFESCDILGCTWTCNKFNHRAPDDQWIARVFFGDPLPDESSMLTHAKRELERLVGIEAEPILHRAYCWPNANPQYDIGHIQRMKALRKDCDLTFTGSSYDGFSISDCITHAKEIPELL